MTPQTTPRRQAEPITIGPRHGYQIDGDHVVINADLQIPPYHSEGNWALELWATEEPYAEGALNGVRIAQLPLELPTSIVRHVHHVDTRLAARLPPQGRAEAMTLALVQHNADASSTIHAFATYPERQTFLTPGFSGAVGYDVQESEVVIWADGVHNPRSRDNLSGTLCLELWAFPMSGPATAAVKLASAELGLLAGQSKFPAIERRVAFSAPPAGRFQIALLVCEWTLAHGYVARDRRDFAVPYEGVASAPIADEPIDTSAVDDVLPKVRPVDKLRLVPNLEKVEESQTKVEVQTKPEAQTKPETQTKVEVQTKPETEAESPQPVTANSPKGMVSIETGSIEELAAVKGLNLKLAKEIVKMRPFSSVADLIRVRGLGTKTIAQLKHLVKV